MELKCEQASPQQDSHRRSGRRTRRAPSRWPRALLQQKALGCGPEQRARRPACPHWARRSLARTSVSPIPRLAKDSLVHRSWNGGDEAFPSSLLSQFSKKSWAYMVSSGRKSPLKLLMSLSQAVPGTNSIKFLNLSRTWGSVWNIQSSLLRMSASF